MSGVGQASLVPVLTAAAAVQECQVSGMVSCRGYHAPAVIPYQLPVVLLQHMQRRNAAAVLLLLLLLSM